MSIEELDGQIRGKERECAEIDKVLACITNEFLIRRYGEIQDQLRLEIQKLRFEREAVGQGTTIVREAGR